MSENPRKVRKSAQSGQAIIFIAVMMVALIGMLGVAIDGGGLFFLRRDTQNAVDAAILAAIYARCTAPSGISASERDALVIQAAVDAAAANTFNHGVNGTEVIARIPPQIGPKAGNDQYVEVIITATKPSFFIQLVYPEALRVTSRAVGYCEPSGSSLLPEAAVITLRPNSGCNNTINDLGFSIAGTADFRTHNNSGVFSNSNDPNCAMDTDGSGNVDVSGPCIMVGGSGSVDEDNCDGGIETADQLTDLHPLSDLARPQCPAGTPSTIADKDYTGATLSPGRYTRIDIKGGASTQLLPGIYCVEEDIEYKGHLWGNGVVIYLSGNNYTIDPRINTNAGGTLQILGPNATNCAAGNTCAWQGLAIWSDLPTNMPNGCTDWSAPPCSGELHINGQAGMVIRGMVYAPGSACTLEGGGNIEIHGQIICYAYRGQGNTAHDYYYQAPEFLQTPPSVEISE